MAPLRELARARAQVLEDAAQAHGAEYEGERRAIGAPRTASTRRRIWARSATRARSSPTTPTLAERMRMLRSHGERATARGIAVVGGVNSRLDELQAEILLRKVEHLDAWNERRRELAAVLSGAARGLAGRAPGRGRRHEALPGTCSSSWSRIATRFAVGCASAASRRSSTTRSRSTSSRRTRTCRASPCRSRSGSATQVVSLPLYPELTDAEAEQVVEAVLAG